MEEDTEYKNLPVEDRCIHKLWKARIDGYNECIKVFEAITDEKSPELRKYEVLMKKFATDSNAVALDRALDAVLAFISNAHVAPRTVADVIAGLVQKALAAPKKTTQDKALNIMLLCVEVEKYEAVQEELMKGFAHKNPKVGAACIRAMTLALKEFGNKVISIKLLIKSIGPLLENRDKNIRDDTKKMVVEMYRWVGAAINSQLASLKPLQLQELEDEFKKIGNEKAVATRLLKSHQERQAKLEEDGGSEAENEEDVDEDDGPKIDPLDLVEEVNILDQLPKDFYDKIEAKKWQDRKEALDAIFVLSQNAKLASGSYGDLVKVLKKVIGKDSNVLLVALAGNCIAGLAKGLRREFSNYAISCIDTILNKFKEKKPNVVASMREAVDAVYQSTTIEAVAETVISVLGSKNPNVKAETASFLARSFCYCTHIMLNKKLIKTYATELLKTLNESDPLVRAASAEALGTIFKIVGEKVMDPFLVDIDEIKKKKIKECSEKAEIKVKAPVIKAKPASKPVAASKTRKPVTRRPVSAKPAAKEIEEVSMEPTKDEICDQDDDPMDENECPEQPRNQTKTVRGKGPLRGQTGRGIPAKKGSRPTSATRTTTTTAQKEKDDQGPLLQVNVMKQSRMKDEQKLKTIRWDFTSPRPDFITQLKDQMEMANVGCQFITQLFHKDFKFHIKAIESLQKDLSNNLDACIANLDLILRWFTIRFFETNPSVIIKAMDYLKQVFNLLSDNNYTLLEYEAYSFVPYLLSKFGDPKDTVRLSAQSIVSLICNIYPVNKISSFILEGLKSKNARQRAVCLETLGTLIETYGMTVCQPTPAVYLKEVAKQISDRDNSVRTAALNTLVQVFYREGEKKLFKFIGTLSAKDMSLLEERIKRSSKNQPTIKKPAIEPQTHVVRPSDSSISVNNTKEVRGSRVVPTVAQPPPHLRNKLKNAPLENENSSTSRLQIDYDFLKKLLNDDVENGNQTNKCNVQLEDVEDIDDFNLEDASLHRITSRLSKSNFSHVKYSTNDNVDDVSKVINSVIAQIANPDAEAVIAALSQLDELMKTDDKRVHLYDHIDQLLIMISLQFRIVLNTKMAESYPKKEECIRVYRSLIHCLLSVFQRDELATRATRDSLHDVVHVILSIIIDTRLTQIEDGTQIIKSLNVLVVRMIENANFTNIFSALLKLLHESVGHSLNGKLIELAMKCNWKTIRTLNSRSKELDVAVILLDLHNFLLAYPSQTWSDKTEKRPLKTIKTVLHNLLEIYGNDILKYVSKIPNYEGAELQKYIHKTLNAAQKTNKEEGSGPKGNNKVSPKADHNSSVKTSGKRLSKVANETLSEIFKKIGSKENKQEGLQQLYEFKEMHPEADIESCLKKSSPFFQNYIERGLKKIEIERQKSPTNTSLEAEQPAPNIDPAIHDMVDEFKALAQDLGFDSSYIQAAVTDIYKN